MTDHLSPPALPSVAPRRLGFIDLRRAAANALRLLRDAIPPAEDDPMADDIVSSLQRAQARWDICGMGGENGDDAGSDSTLASVAAALALDDVTQCPHLGPWPVARTIVLDHRAEYCDECVPSGVVVSPTCAFCGRGARRASLYSARIGSIIVIGTGCTTCRTAMIGERS